MTQWPVVILPGWLVGVDRYDALAKGLQEAGFETHVVNFPGFDKSQPLSRVYYLSDYVKYLEKYLKSRHIRKAIFVCHSFGGRVALKLLSQEPQLAYALILSGTPGFPSISRWRKKLMKSVAKIGKIVSFLPPFLFIRPVLRRLLYRGAGSYDYQKLDGFLKKTFEHIVDESLEEYMRKIRIPTLLLWGEKDRLVSLKIARRMQKTIKNAKLIVLSNKGHMVTYREPELTIPHVLNFINSL